MNDADRFAQLICDWCLEVREGQQVLIATSELAMEPVRALHRAILVRGAWPLLRISPSWQEGDFLRHASAAQLEGYPPLSLEEAQQADARVRIMAPANVNALAGVEPALIRRAARAREPLREHLARMRWCLTIWPTAALAQAAGMGEDDYATFLRGALFLDRPDPTAGWRELSVRQERAVARLSQAQEIHIEADGTDLRLRVGGRRWINSDGRRNMPSGEVFTGPHEDSAEGRIRFAVPTSPAGVEVGGVELEFRGGEVVGARAERGQRYLEAALASDSGARRLGEIGIGTNTGIDRPTGSILLDEKMAGTVHLALGRSYPETGGTNVSSLHWDLICDLRAGGRLSADGEILSEGGAGFCVG